MTNDFQVMNDYLSALELDLKNQAALTATSRRRAPRLGRPMIALAFSAVVVSAVLVISGSAGREVPAYGKPAILNTPASDIPEPLRQGLALQLAPGPNATLTEARAVPAFGGTAYLLSGNDTWCLSAPDAESMTPDAEPGVTCTHTSEFFRIGISLVVGDHYIAAIPQGVENPTLTHADDTKVELRPNQQGVVVVEKLAPGDTVSLHGTGGQIRTDRPAAGR